MKAKRTYVSVAAAMAVGLVVASCGSSGEDGPTALDPDADLSTQSIVVSNYESYMPEDLPARFSAASGAQVDVAYHASNEEIVAKATAGDSGIDVAFINGVYAQALAAQGLLEPIDPRLVPNLANLYPEANTLPYDPGNKISVPYAWGTTGLCYRSDLTGYDPDSWLDLLEPRPEISGKTTMVSTERWLLLPALKSLGFSNSTQDEEELNQAKEVLLRTKPTLLAYDDVTFYQRLVSGEASLVQAYDGWCNYGITDNPDIKYVVPKEGTDLWVDVMVIMKTSENKEAAHAFINFVLEPEIHSWVTENILYKSPNKAAMDMISPELIEQYPNIGTTVEELFEQEPLVDVGDAGPLYTRIALEVSAAD